jgi:DNA-binding response OmpR family regulator
MEPEPTAAASILAVDSDGVALSALVDLLRCEGYQATGAATFEKAKQSLDGAHYDLLMADVRLHAFNGLHLVARSRVFSQAMAAIVFAGAPDAVIEGEARRLGARYVVKPIEPEALLKVVRDTLEGAKFVTA